MFNTISLGGAGMTTAFVSILIFVAGLLGLDIAEAEVTQFVESALFVVGFVMMVAGQIKRKDLKYGVIRK